MITLVLEASTYSGSTALLVDGRLVGERSVAMRGREHEALMPAVAALLEECGVAPRGVGRVVCGEGPGAFTSLRVAASIAKGIALAAGSQLVPVSSLALLVASQAVLKPGRFLAAVDAMRGEHYVQLFEIDAHLDLHVRSPLGMLPAGVVDAQAHSLDAVAIGPERGEVFSVTPHARAAARITKVIDGIPPADLAGWEPGYGRLAEAQVKWEAQHGRPLVAG